MRNSELAIALRSTLYSPAELLEFSGLVDESKKFQTIFFPDITASYDSIELSAAALAVTRQVRAGSGVLRPLEHGVEALTRRLSTVQFISNNRFILGVGTGRPSPNPAQTIGRLLNRVEDVRKRFESEFGGRRLEMPKVFMAALRRGIAKISIAQVDGLILNFCSPGYAADLVGSARQKVGREAAASKTFACFIKIFYSADTDVARRLMVSEFQNYDRNPQYHQMFERDGVASDIGKMSGLTVSTEIPKSMAQISLANPSVHELNSLVDRFRSAGVGLPCLYPYFAPSDDTAFKLGVMEEMMNVK